MPQILPRPCRYDDRRHPGSLPQLGAHCRAFHSEEPRTTAAYLERGSREQRFGPGLRRVPMWEGSVCYLENAKCRPSWSDEPSVASAAPAASSTRSRRGNRFAQCRGGKLDRPYKLGSWSPSRLSTSGFVNNTCPVPRIPTMEGARFKDMCCV